MRILFIGDIVGEPGRTIIYDKLKVFKESNNIDFAIANVENLAGGFGVTLKTLRSIIDSGVDFCTSGNHIWDNKEVLEFIDNEPLLIRPANYPESCPGTGCAVIQSDDKKTLGIINISGRTFMAPLDNPFSAADKCVSEMSKQTRIIIVDFHAEATSEKLAMGYYLDGKVSAVIGTHTHVQTADERILPGGTAVISDVGMTGGHDSILGVEKEAVLVRFNKMLPSKLTPAWGDIRMSYVIVDIDNDSGRSFSINRGQLSK